MQYRPLGNSGVKVSVISFGSMRYPDEETACRILNRGLDLGLNYVDTSSGYIDGKSEQWSGAAIRRRRGEVYFSDKSAWASAPKADGVRANIERQLKAAGLDYFDFYQLWGLDKEETLREALVKRGFVAGVRKAQRDGLIKHGLGFTFHGTPKLFRAAVDSGEFCCATVSYNLMNRAEEPNIAYAASKGVGVIVMNPLAGGLLGLAGDPALDFLRREGGKAGPWWGALRFLHANPGITTSIVGFTAVAEVNQAASTLKGVQGLGEDYRADLVSRMDGVKFTEGHFCTGCGYCKECPHGFKPTRFMQVMRDFEIYRVKAKDLTHWILSKYPHQNIRELMAKCCECAQCQEKCPQHLEIVESIRKGKAALGVK
ncbi:MAG: aldo/keto reductase [Phycisphaerae bacterium]|nr:aldo/keto reductase [Phycisphaerae bacterium]